MAPCHRPPGYWHPVHDGSSLDDDASSPWLPLTLIQTLLADLVAVGMVERMLARS
jgi:hypothetical protein